MLSTGDSQQYANPASSLSRPPPAKQQSTMNSQSSLSEIAVFVAGASENAGAAAVCASGFSELKGMELETGEMPVASSSSLSSSEPDTACENCGLHCVCAGLCDRCDREFCVDCMDEPLIQCSVCSVRLCHDCNHLEAELICDGCNCSFCFGCSDVLEQCYNCELFFCHECWINFGDSRKPTKCSVCMFRLCQNCIDPGFSRCQNCDVIWCGYNSCQPLRSCSCSSCGIMFCDSCHDLGASQIQTCERCKATFCSINPQCIEETKFNTKCSDCGKIWCVKCSGEHMDTRKCDRCSIIRCETCMDTATQKFLNFCASCDGCLCNSCTSFTHCSFCEDDECEACSLSVSCVTCYQRTCLGCINNNPDSGLFCDRCGIFSCSYCHDVSNSICYNCSIAICPPCQSSLSFSTAFHGPDHLCIRCFTWPRSQRVNNTMEALPDESRLFLHKPYPSCQLLLEMRAAVENRAARVIQRNCHNWLWKPVQRDGSQCIHIRLAFRELREHLFADK